MKKIILILILILTDSSYTQWTALNTGTSQNLNSVHFINIQTGFAAGVNGTVIKTTNAGGNWVILNSGSTVELKAVYFINSSTGMVCGYNGTILRTTNGGDNWSAVNSGTSDNLHGLSFYNELTGVSTGGSGTMLYTTNGGVNWLIGQPTGYMVTFYSAYMLNASTGFCAGINTILSPLWAKTTNGGASWVYNTFMLNSNEGTLRDIHFFDSQYGIAVSNLWNGQGGISRTTNGGVNWITQLFQYGFYGIDFPAPAIGYTAGQNGYIYKSTDGGINWVQQISNTSVFLRSVDFVDTINGYIAGNGGVILKTTNGGITAVTKNEHQIPSEYKLYQNYPNPFNPVTKIKFSLPFPSKGGVYFVSLIVYDVLGKEVASLIPPLGGGQEGLNPGTYEVEWSATGGASNYPGGVYFYRLIVSDASSPQANPLSIIFSETRKMVLIK